MRGVIKRIAMGLAVLACLASAGACVVFHAARQEPEFYRHAMQIDPQCHVPAGESLEKDLLHLRNQARVPGEWETTFSEQQLNGWLAAEMPEKFPRVLPRGVKHPRVDLKDGEIHAAAKFEDGFVSCVVSFIVELELTDEPNTVAVRAHKIRAGSLPVTIQQVLNGISRAARRGDIPLRWAEKNGEFVAHVTIPSRHEDYSRQEIVVEKIELRDGAVYLAGRTRQSPSYSGSIAQQLPARGYLRAGL